MNWLVEQFTLRRLKSGTIVLPTTDFFPDDYQVTDAEVRNILEIVCRHMDWPVERVRLDYYEDAHPRYGMDQDGELNPYENTDDGFPVCLDVRSVDDPFTVVGVLAHEVGHIHLLGQGRLSRDAEDLEPLADLLAVFMGLGILVSSIAIRESHWRIGAKGAGWIMERCTYLSMDQFGYALALYQLARGDGENGWTKYLRPDVLNAYRQGIRYVQETGDCTFRYIADA
jgi:hypothetical protein